MKDNDFFNMDKKKKAFEKIIQKACENIYKETEEQDLSSIDREDIKILNDFMNAVAPKPILFMWARLLFTIDNYKIMAKYHDELNSVAIKSTNILRILKPRIKLKDSILVAFLELSGFVFKDSEEYKLLKEWLDGKV